MNVYVCLYVMCCFCFVLFPIVKIVLVQICSRKLDNVYYENSSSAKKCLSQSEDGRLSLFSDQPDKHKLGRGH